MMSTQLQESLAHLADENVDGLNGVAL